MQAKPRICPAARPSPSPSSSNSLSSAKPLNSGKTSTRSRSGNQTSKTAVSSPPQNASACVVRCTVYGYIPARSTTLAIHGRLVCTATLCLSARSSSTTGAPPNWPRWKTYEGSYATCCRTTSARATGPFSASSENATRIPTSNFYLMSISTTRHQRPHRRQRSSSISTARIR